MALFVAWRSQQGYSPPGLSRRLVEAADDLLGMYRTCGEASLRWRLRFREINMLLALWNRMSGIRGRCSRVL